MLRERTDNMSQQGGLPCSDCSRDSIDRQVPVAPIEDRLLGFTPRLKDLVRPKSVSFIHRNTKGGTKAIVIGFLLIKHFFKASI